MNLIIFTDNEDSYPQLMAEGLQRMLRQIAVESKIFYDGHDCLDSDEFPENYLNEIEKSDCMIIVGYLPGLFLKNHFTGVEILREKFPEIPIVFYANYYLSTLGPWYKWLKEGNSEVEIYTDNNWGLERYDWYLATSVISEYPMPEGFQPYSWIGVNLNDGTLFPEVKEEFIALIDFERTDYLYEREIQIQALEETNTKYIVLNGFYKIQDIRKIYRTCSLYFVAHYESFGMPICELQACGSYIFTPYSEWCAAHWKKGDLSANSPGKLTSNFIVYNNNKKNLINKIKKIKKSYNSQDVLKTFLKEQPYFFNGNIPGLENFINKLATKEIHSKLHIQNAFVKCFK